MSTQSRRLVQRSRPNNENSSPAQRGGGRPRDAPAAREPAALPPYEAPRFPLTATARRDLENLRENHDYSKYKKHLDSAIKTITASAAEINDELSNREERIRRRDEKRGDDEKTEEDKQVEGSTRAMGKKVRGLTAEAEQAVRELIDYGDELSMQETMMRDVSQTIAEAPVVERRAPRRRNREVDAEKGGENDEDASEDGEDEPEEDPNVPSAIELLKQAKLDYRIQYAAKTMRERQVTLWYFTEHTNTRHLDMKSTTTDNSKTLFMMPKTTEMTCQFLTQTHGSQKTTPTKAPALADARTTPRIIQATLMIPTTILSSRDQRRA